MREKHKIPGQGTDIPPKATHVTIYFLEKGKSNKCAEEFFTHYSKLDWKNKRGALIRDWKMHAWEWIWGKPK